VLFPNKMSSTTTTTMPTTAAPAFNWTDAVVFKNPDHLCEDCEKPDDHCDCEVCWDCEEQVATHGHFCGDCNLEPLMCRSTITKPGVCRLCADDDYKVEAIGSYGEDNIPMCGVCKEVGRFNSDGTKKSPGNDDDECPGCLSADCKQCDSTSDAAKEQYRQWCKDNNVDE